MDEEDEVFDINDLDDDEPENDPYDGFEYGTRILGVVMKKEETIETSKYESHINDLNENDNNEIHNRNFGVHMVKAEASSDEDIEKMEDVKDGDMYNGINGSKHSLDSMILPKPKSETG